MDLFLKAKTAAKTAISPKNVELTNWIGGGPSLKARVRFAIVIAFLLMTPMLFVGVIRIDIISSQVNWVQKHQKISSDIFDIKFRIDSLREAVFKIENAFKEEIEIDFAREILLLESSIINLNKSYPNDFFYELLKEIKLITKTISFLDLDIVSRVKFRELLLASTKQMDLVSVDLLKQINTRNTNIINSILAVGRDQIILFLLLLFVFPFFMIIIPRWIVAPLSRLGKMSQTVQAGKIHELWVAGNDEVSKLARALKAALSYREELEEKKSSKIFEIRNVLRAVIMQVMEPILILDKARKVSYANKAAAELLKIETHNIEGKILDECISCETLWDYFDNIQEKNLERSKSFDIVLKNGKHVNVFAKITQVHNREGDISRYILMFVSG